MAALRSKPQSATELPRFDGQLMNLGGWLRALRQQEHLLPSDLSYFTKTGAQVMNNGKVAVISAHHALLLHGGLLAQCDFSITRPPPVGDRFVELYRRVRLGQDGLTSAGITLPATVDANAVPDEYSDIYFVRPISIAALDLKLRDDLLSLMEGGSSTRARCSHLDATLGCICSIGSSTSKRTLTQRTPPTRP